VTKSALAFAIVDLRLLDGYGLDVVPTLREERPDMRIVILTGYGNIASTVAAVKAGAVDYLGKSADDDEIQAALMAQPGSHAAPPAEHFGQAFPPRIIFPHTRPCHCLVSAPGGQT
jgi:two-component system response regulator RegA